MTIELLSGIERPPRREDYCTKIAGAPLAPAGVPHPLWDAFLNRVTSNNSELIVFLRRFLGYCMTGFTHEHVFMFLYGTGANGKGVFLNTITQIMGDYAIIAPMEMFLTSRFDRHPTEIARLKGARIVVAQETQRGRSWDEAKIKTLTSSDTLTGRFMRGNFFDFTPSHKLIIAGNSKPRLRNADEAMRRRLLLVPFTVQIRPPNAIHISPISSKPSGRPSCDGCSTDAWNGSATGSEYRNPFARRPMTISPTRIPSDSGRTSTSLPIHWPSPRQTCCSRRGRRGAMSVICHPARRQHSSKA